jgi:hypothetical protein
VDEANLSGSPCKCRKTGRETLKCRILIHWAWRIPLVSARPFTQQLFLC